MGAYLIIATAILLCVVTFILLEYQGPKYIYVNKDNIFGRDCLRAKDLIIQEFDSAGNLWGSRGMIIYRMKKLDDKFIRIAHLPSSSLFFWLNNFRFVRKLTMKPECIEMTIVGDNIIVAFSSGIMWYYEPERKKFRKTLKLAHYGIGIGRGIMSNGLLKTNYNSLFVGEYFRNRKRQHVRIYKSKNSGLTWEIAHEFRPGIIRHIHALKVDPHTGKLWICTGDRDNESMIGWSDDEYKSITPIGQGSMIWKACHLAFTEEAVYWGTDSDSEDLAGIYRWDKKSTKLTCLTKIDGAVYYSTKLANGTIVMSTGVESLPYEKDNRTYMFLINKEDQITKIQCGTREIRKPNFRNSYAIIRFQRNPINNSLVLSCLNQKETSDGDLLIFNEDAVGKYFN